MNTIRFAKHHALGNDFLVALAPPHEQAAPELPGFDGPALASRLCDRSGGIGADGLILATDQSLGQPDSTPDGPDSGCREQVRHVRMRLFNSDGSSAEVSGNGLACLAHEAARSLVSSMESHDSAANRDSVLELTVDTADGTRQVTLDAELATTEDGSLVLVDPYARVHMPNVAPGPGIADELDEQIRKSFGSNQRATGDVGNPHLVINAGRPVGTSETARLGAAFEAHFPVGINVEFIWRTGYGDSAAATPSSIGMSVWERGAGLTQACGTGAVTAAVRARDWGLVEPGVETVVEMPGGEAIILTAGDDGHPVLNVAVEHLGDYERPMNEPTR